MSIMNRIVTEQKAENSIITEKVKKGVIFEIYKKFCDFCT